MRAVAGRRSWDVKNSRVEQWRLRGCQLFAHTWTPPRANVESIFQQSIVRSNFTASRNRDSLQTREIFPIGGDSVSGFRA